MQSDIKAHVYAAIDKAKLVMDPFPHFQATEVFPTGFYSELIAKLPADGDYERYAAPYEERRFIQLTATTSSRLSGEAGPFWHALEAWMHSQEFLDHMTKKFASQLPINRKFRQRQLDKNGIGDGKVRISPRSLLVRDYANFALGPHTDSGSKFIVGAFYFPKDHSLREFGTSIYTPVKQGQTAWDSPHMPHEDFELVRTIENVPNSFFVFMKTSNSWHGVEKKSHANIGRDVLFWIPQIGPADGAEHELSLPRSLFEDKPSFWSRIIGG